MTLNLIMLFLPCIEGLSIILFCIIVFLVILFFLYSISKNANIRMLEKKNRDLESNSDFSQIEIIKIREALDNRFEYLKEIIDITYKTCDNEPKFKEKIGNKFLEDKKKGELGRFFSDIFFLTNQCSKGLVVNLREKYSLTNKELQLCCLLYWGFNWSQICTIENITESTYYVKCFRIKSKLNLNKEEQIQTFLRKYQQS